MSPNLLNAEFNKERIRRIRAALWEKKALDKAANDGISRAGIERHLIKPRKEFEDLDWYQLLVMAAEQHPHEIVQMVLELKEWIIDRLYEDKEKRDEVEGDVDFEMSQFYDR